MGLKLTTETKIYAVQKCLSKQVSKTEMARRLGVCDDTVKLWIDKYESLGADSFNDVGMQKYSEELKQEAVKEYLAGNGSYRKICKKYKIKSMKQLHNWVKRYNSHEESKTGGIIIMTQRRKTTFEERVELVQYCISHDYNYIETAKKYNVSYQQARNYTHKYEKEGIDGLVDRRGRAKPIEEMSEIERLRAEIRILRAEKERAEMEASFLKKLEEIERRRG